MVTTYKWTMKQWHQLIKTGVLAGAEVEFLDGEIVERVGEGIPHSFTGRSIGGYLRSLLADVALISEAYPITLDNSPHSRASEPRPDIAIVRLPEAIYARHHPKSEDIYWLIEISNSTLKIDKTKKAAIYARNKISEYWILDLVNKNLIVHTEPKNNEYQQISQYQTGLVYSLAFPNIAIALNKLLLF